MKNKMFRQNNNNEIKSVFISAILQIVTYLFLICARFPLLYFLKYLHIKISYISLLFLREQLSYKPVHHCVCLLL